MPRNCCKNVALGGVGGIFLPESYSCQSQTAMAANCSYCVTGKMPASPRASTRDVKAARNSISGAAPPLTWAGGKGECQPPRYRRNWPAARSKTCIPSCGAMNSHSLPFHPASSPSCMPHSPAAPLATSHRSPSTGSAGGVPASACTAGWCRKSDRTCARLTKHSFCDWPGGVAVLRTAQGLRLGRRIEEGLRPVGPAQPVERRLEGRAVFRR